jgi:hypothetical protein
LDRAAGRPTGKESPYDKIEDVNDEADEDWTSSADGVLKAIDAYFGSCFSMSVFVFLVCRGFCLHTPR